MPFDCTLAKLNPDRTKVPINCGGVILAVAAMCASTSRTVQSVHSDGAAHWASVSPCRSAASAFRSAWMMPQRSVLTIGCPSPTTQYFSIDPLCLLDECTKCGYLRGNGYLR